MAPDDPPSTATPSRSEYVQQGLTASFDILAAFAEKLPFPAAPIFTLAKSVIANVETVQDNVEECGVLKDHLGQLLPVVLAAMEEESKRPGLVVPARLKQHVDQFHKTLKKIDETMVEVKKATDSKRKRDKIITFVMPKWYTNKIKKCKDDLDRAMRLFAVADQLKTSLVICGISDRLEVVAAQVEVVSGQVEGVSSQVGVVGEKVDGISGQVEGVSIQVGGVSTQVEEVSSGVKLVRGDVQEVSGQVERVSDRVEVVADQVGGVSSQVGVATAAVIGVAGEVAHVTNIVADTSTNVATVLTNSLLESLPRAKEASSNCAAPDLSAGCFEGTRVETIKTIREWMLNPDPSIPKCFWMSGIAGVGKTTVAYSIVRIARELRILGADFFFSRLGKDELRDPALVFPTLAYQLAFTDPEFARVITAALQAHPDAGSSSRKIQLDTLIINPLSTLTPDPSRIVVLILDAFDECEATGAKEILQLLVDSLSRLPFFLKIIITSRPENHIKSVLLPSSKLSVTRLHDIEKHIVAGDIKRYLTARLRGLPKQPGFEYLSEDWITDDEIQILVDAAGALFVYAATSLRFLTDEVGLTPRELLDILLDIIRSPRAAVSSSANPYKDLDALYQQILVVIVSRKTGAVLTDRFKQVVGTIILLRDPLSVTALSNLIPLKEDAIMALISTVQSVILLPSSPADCPRVFHPSFPDFLQDHTRCTDDNLWIDTPAHEARVALRCLDIMNALLHKDMLGPFEPCLLNSEVPDLSEKIKAAFTSELLYACRHWASHLAAVPHPADARIIQALNVFCSRVLLPWLESISWIGQTRLAIPSLEAANAWAAKSTCSAMTISLLNDTYRLLLAHFLIITQSAPHIARSVLPFAPRSIPLISTYANYADPYIRVIEGADQQWSACLMTLKGHTNTVTSVAVSPDGTRIVSGSDDDTVCIWNSNSGDLITVLEGHTNRVASVAFSPGGERIVSGSWDKTVRLWDVTIGREVSKLEGHDGWVRTVAFSPDGGRIASGSGDQTIRIWDAAAGSVLRTLKGHSGHVLSLVFFPDGRQLASGSVDLTVRVWDLKEGNCVAKLEGHSNLVFAVAISPDGLQIASGSADKTLRIWEVSTGTCTKALQGHTASISAVAFSPNGSRIISGSDDKTVQLWDATTYDNIASYSGHAGGVTSVVFSHDGRRIVSGSEDQSIKIWDASAVQGDTEEEDGASPAAVASLAISSDCSRLLVLTWGPAPVQLAVQIRDPTTPLNPNAAFEFTDWMSFNWRFPVWFSADNTCIVIKSDKGRFVYNASNGDRVGKLEAPDSELQNEPLFRLEDGRVLRHGSSSESSSVACILPHSLQASAIASWEIDGEAGHRILVGCKDGRIITLHVA